MIQNTQPRKFSENQRRNIKLPDWPNHQSPDLNPSVNLWRELKISVHGRGPQNEEDWAKLTAEWTMWLSSKKSRSCRHLQRLLNEVLNTFRRACSILFLCVVSHYHKFMVIQGLLSLHGLLPTSGENCSLRDLRKYIYWEECVQYLFYLLYLCPRLY